MLTRIELIIIEHALGSYKLELDKILSKKYALNKYKVELKHDLVLRVLKKIDDMIGEMEKNE